MRRAGTQSRLTALLLVSTLVIAGGVSGIVLADHPSSSQSDGPTVEVNTSTNATTEWPMFQRNTRNSGTSNASPLLSDVGIEWVNPTGISIETSPAVADGRVYFGNWNGSVFAADAQSGDVLWQYQTDGRVRSSPAVTNGTVYIGSGDGNIYALDAATGELQWEFSTQADISYASPTVDGDTVYIGSMDNHLYALNISTGEERWNFDTGAIANMAPAAHNNTVYMGGEDLHALDAATGTVKWTYETPSWVTASPTIVDGTVYAAGGAHVDEEGYIYAVDASTGDLQWSTTVAEPVTESSPSVSEGVLVVGNKHQSTIFGVDATTGDILWQHQTWEDVDSSPAIVNETVYIGSDDDRLYALDLHTGEVKWTFETRVAVKSSPAVTNETIYIGSGAGDMIALQEGSGSEITGQVAYPNGTASSGDSVYFHQNTSGVDYSIPTRTTGDGEYQADLPANVQYRVGFVQGSIESGSGLAADDAVPDLYALGNATTTHDINQGNITLPEAYDVNVTTVDNDGNPVSNATVTIRHSSTEGEAWYGWIRTNEDGMLEIEPRGHPGMDLVGNVTVVAIPPENSTISDEYVVKNISVTESTAVNVTFDEESIPGDVNGDGEVTPVDATLTQRYIVGLPIDGEFDEEAADVSGDGTVGPQDVTLIQRIIVGLPIN